MRLGVVRTAQRRALYIILPFAMSSPACTGVVDDSPFGPASASVESPGATITGRPIPAGTPDSEDVVSWVTRFAKLSNSQWENSVRTLFYLESPTGLSKGFTQEPLDKGYEPYAASGLTVGGDAWSRYQTAAEQVAEMIVSDDAKLGKISPSGSFGTPAERGAAFIRAFGRRAYRRPLGTDEQRSYEALFARGPELFGGDAYKAGVRVVIEAMLQSPSFVYRVETSQNAEVDRKIKLSGFEVASRLSYALWNDMPSDALLDAAGAGELDTREGVARWAERMLDDPRANDVLLSFHEQTFQTTAYGTQDKEESLGFDAAALAPTLREEARRFFDLVVLQRKAGIAELLTDRTAFVNERTASFYGLTGVSGTALQPRELDGRERAGLLTQLGFLSKNATRSGSDPVHRGLTVIRRVLCDEPDPPPMMFQLPQPVAGLTTREVYERATACGGTCHADLINPAGFAFERLDTVGRTRTTEAGKPIDASGILSVRTGFTPEEKRSGTATKLSFNGAVELMTQLAKEPRVHECYARNWMEYVLAREPDPSERGVWRKLGETSRSASSARALLLALVQLDTFRYRVSEAP